jgi:hypothetical protein
MAPHAVSKENLGLPVLASPQRAFQSGARMGKGQLEKGVGVVALFSRLAAGASADAHD